MKFELKSNQNENPQRRGKELADGQFSRIMGQEDAFIRIQHVDKFFGSFQALDDVSLDIHLGQKIVICGPSGSGKSTAIRCINRLEAHDAGEIAIDGVRIDDSAAARRVLRGFKPASP